jgi:hypothetical protein
MSARDVPFHREEGRTFTSFLHVDVTYGHYISIYRAVVFTRTSAEIGVVGRMRSNGFTPVDHVHSGDV